MHLTSRERYFPHIGHYWALGAQHKILGEIKTHAVLTVDETDTFASDGGMINLKIEGERINLQINVNAAPQARLQISSKLLSLAQIVK